MPRRTHELHECITNSLTAKGMASFSRPEQNRPMDPVTLTTDRLCCAPWVRTTPTPSTPRARTPTSSAGRRSRRPYLREHAGFTAQIVPDGWRGRLRLHLRRLPPRGGALVGRWVWRLHHALPWAAGRARLLGRRRSTAATATPPRPSAPSRWAFTDLSVDRVEWRAEVGNNGSRAVAEEPASPWRAPCAPRSTTRAYAGTPGSAPCSPPTWASPRSPPYRLPPGRARRPAPSG